MKNNRNKKDKKNKKQGPKNKDKKEYKAPKKIKEEKMINEKNDDIEIDQKYIIGQSEKDKILKAIEKKQFNFDPNSLSEDDIENLNEDNIYLGKFTFKKLLMKLIFIILI